MEEERIPVIGADGQLTDEYKAANPTDWRQNHGTLDALIKSDVLDEDIATRTGLTEEEIGYRRAFLNHEV